MRLTVIGAGGMLGTDMCEAATDAGFDVIRLDRRQADICDVEALADALPFDGVVVNCAAWTDVDLAESREADAFRINAVGAANLARVTASRDLGLIHISTDYVLRGTGLAPAGEDALLDPATSYGRTKAAGEWAAFAYHPGAVIVRTAWLYGANGRCFPKAIAARLRAGDPVSVVTDQRGQPTWTKDLADLIVRVAGSGVTGEILHGTSAGECTWHDFAQEVAASLGKDPVVVGTSLSADAARPAPRPAYSVLGHEALTRLGITPIGDWRERWHAAAPQVLAQKGLGGAAPAGGAAG